MKQARLAWPGKQQLTGSFQEPQQPQQRVQQRTPREDRVNGSDRCPRELQGMQSSSSRRGQGSTKSRDASSAGTFEQQIRAVAGLEKPHTASGV